MQLDSMGRFTWTPSLDLMNRLGKQEGAGVIFQAQLKDGKHLRHPVNFMVHHVNRPPVVGELPTFCVKQNIPSHYQIPSDYARDQDGDAVNTHSNLHEEVPNSKRTATN